MSEALAANALFFLGFGFALAEPLGAFAGFALAGVVFHAGGDGFGFGIEFKLEDEPLSSFDGGEGESFFGLGNWELLGALAVAGDGGEGLLGDGDGLHVFVQDGDVEAVALHGDLTVQGFVFAELEDASSIGADLHAFMGESEAGEKGDGEGGEFGFHGWIGLGLVFY